MPPCPGKPPRMPNPPPPPPPPIPCGPFSCPYESYISRFDESLRQSNAPLIALKAPSALGAAHLSG